MPGSVRAAWLPNRSSHFRMALSCGAHAGHPGAPHRSQPGAWVAKRRTDERRRPERHLPHHADRSRAPSRRATRRLLPPQLRRTDHADPPKRHLPFPAAYTACVYRHLRRRRRPRPLPCESEDVLPGRRHGALVTRGRATAPARDRLHEPLRPDRLGQQAVAKDRLTRAAECDRPNRGRPLE